MQICSELPTIIIDIGTEFTKIGYATQESPLFFNPTRTSANNFKSPLINGKIEDISEFCMHLTNSLKAFDKSLYTQNQPQDYYSLVICMNNNDENDQKHTEKILNHVFSNLDGHRSPFNAVLFVNTLLCDLFGNGKVNGMIVSLSSDISVAGITEGLIFKTFRSQFGSTDVTNKIHVMYEKEISDVLSCKSNNERPELMKFRKDELAREIKESILVMKIHSEASNYELPHKIILNVDKDKIEEITDDILKKTIDLIKQVIEKCEADRKNIIMNNIVLTGGMANIPGLYEKIVEELIKIYPPSKIKVIFEKNIFHTFLGASVIGSLGSMKSFFISRADYDCFGTGILAKKNFKWATNK